MSCLKAPERIRPLRRRSTLAVLASLTACTAASPGAQPSEATRASAPAAVVDGDFSEWGSAPVAVLDRREGGAGIDFGEVRALADGEAAYLLVDVGGSVNLQVLGTPMRLALDLDGHAETGGSEAGLEGADLVVTFSPADSAGRPGQGVAVHRVSDGARGTAYDIGFVFGPTHSSSRFELRIDREAAVAFAGLPGSERWRGRWTAEPGSAVPGDATAIFQLELPPAAAVASLPEAADPLERALRADVRVVAWNMADRGILERPTSFARVLRALNADVLLLDELPGGMDAARLQTFLDRLGGEWRFALGEGGGRQRAAVASRLPLEPAPALVRVDYDEDVSRLAPLAHFPQTRRDLTTGPEDGVSTAGAVVLVGDRRLLFVALDLACCGGADDVEDRLRTIQARAINRAAARAIRAGQISGVVVGGDFNLVGSPNPLDTLAAGLDPGGPALRVAPMLQLDGRTATTWRSPGPFPAGRLDYVLYSASSLEPLRAFAFDPADVHARWLRHHDLDVAAAERTSDHLPVVVDLRLR